MHPKVRRLIAHFTTPPREKLRAPLTKILSIGVLSSLPFIAQAEISVVDFLGRTVTLEKPATRIVALAPHIVENIFSAGGGQQIIGAVDYCDYPKAALKIPRVGAITTFNYEAILALKPDLVVSWHSGHGSKALTKLEKLGLTVYASNPKSLKDVAKAIKDYGNLTGHSTQADANAKAYDKTLNQLSSRYRHQPPVSVLYQVWNAPLQTLNDKHIISDVIALCGGKNSFGDAIPLAPKISIESVIHQDPETIIASGMGESRPDWLDEWKQWPNLTATKFDNLFFIPPDIIQRHTVRMLEGAKIMCKHLETARQRKQKQKQKQQ